MRKTIVLGSILALVGLASIAQASDWSHLSDSAATRMHREVSDDSRGNRHDRYEQKDRSRERHHESSERRRESHEMHDESDERRDYRP